MRSDRTPDSPDASKGASRSPGNEGSRGSRGIGNSGARPDEIRNDEDPSGDAQATDTTDADARGGGGIASGSERSK